MRRDTSIFNARDSRGAVLRFVHANVALRLGQAFGRRVRAARQEASVGRGDAQLSHRQPAATLARGLAGPGVDALDIGLASTPEPSLTTHNPCHGSFGGTGSHNPFVQRHRDTLPMLPRDHPHASVYSRAP